MKKYRILITLICLLNFVYAVEPNEISILPGTTAKYLPCAGGLYLPSIGDIHIMIIFAEFPDDTYETSDPRWIKGYPPANMNNWIDSIWTGYPTQGSLTHYFAEMSKDKYKVTGDVFHVITAQNRKWYRKHSMRRGKIHKEILQSLDRSIDFSAYDNWSYRGKYDLGDLCNDGIIEMIIFVWRNVWEDSVSYKNALGFANNYATIGNIGDIHVDSDIRTIKTAFGGLGATPHGSGVTIMNYLKPNHDPFRVVVHEYAHYLLGGNDMHNGFAWWGALSSWGYKAYIANSFERYQLQWSEEPDIYTINTGSTLTSTITLPDDVTTGKSLRIAVNPSKNQYFYIENHQKLSYWENHAPFSRHPENIDGLIEKGFYVIRQNGLEGNQRELLPADGRYDWEVNQKISTSDGILPVFKRLNPNPINGYHDLIKRIPYVWAGITEYNNVMYTENSDALPIKDLRYRGDGNDAFRVGYNEVFSQWSNPNSDISHGESTNFAFKVNDENAITIYINTALDGPPSKPQLCNTALNGSNPRLSWITTNAEPDIKHYEIWKKNGSSASWFIREATPDNYYVDEMDEYPTVYYKVRAVDIEDNMSTFTEEVQVNR
jgi:M6 family metalloprotease-like protein